MINFSSSGHIFAARLLFVSVCQIFGAAGPSPELILGLVVVGEQEVRPAFQGYG